MVRKRGQQYYWQGRVRLKHATNTRVEATVSGSQAYQVTLEWQGHRLDGKCTCPFADSDGPCKHMWATILKADAGNHLSAAGWVSQVSLNTDVAERLLPNPAAGGRPTRWESVIENIAKPLGPDIEWPSARQILYFVDVGASTAAGALVIAVAARDRKRDGSFGKISPRVLSRKRIAALPVAEDRDLLSRIAGGEQYYGYTYMDAQLPSSFAIPYPLSETILEAAIRTGRCYVRRGTGFDNLSPLSWEEGEPWKLELHMERADAKNWTLRGRLTRATPSGPELIELNTPELLLPHGPIICAGVASRLAPDTSASWVSHLRTGPPVRASERESDDLLMALLTASNLPPLKVPEELRFQEVAMDPQPRLQFSQHAQRAGLTAQLSFDYGGHTVPELPKARGFFEEDPRRFILRDRDAEYAAAARLTDLGLRFHPPDFWNKQGRWELTASRLPRAARALVEAGWHVEAEGKAFRRPGSSSLRVSSGVDWFELHGEVRYGDTTAKLPELLAALRRGDNMVRLGDGTFGMLPDEWLKRLAPLAGMGHAEDGHMRFSRAQAGLLDALLATQPEASCDAVFTKIRKQMNRFDGVKAARQPKGFVGHLRDYQREGLGWMEFLREFSFGGCLADDMGVGKTAQVLAMLETRRVARAAGEAIGPSLVVVPRSLVFNWREEAERFTPQLRVLDYTGLTRSAEEIAGYDVILTTYGTLRRDAPILKDIEFDYVVLDESQAVKNALTESSKAVRLLRSSHRLALSGTPVENHLGELWTLFEFLNPGMLGTASVFKLAGGAGRNLDEDTRALLAHALRPFILRRTKQQVARELPAKTEQTIYCDLEPPQRKLYNELREHYRQSLLTRVDTFGLAKSKIQVLEALLRLRQASCHPGLLDPKKLAEPSAKLDVLFEQLHEVIEGGHKALVFSQFTSFLAILREKLDCEKIVYEYLDGHTRDRKARVDRFQNDAACPLFLISLKAGGLGLNLTAAEYVFLLDPWWNPAVEAQAVDRAHRIGQKRPVSAYRLIARDTVEEKVLELQKTKRDLAEAIIASGSVMKDLKREDLELLLT